jgi:hypothetical protein
MICSAPSGGFHLHTQVCCQLKPYKSSLFPLESGSIEVVPKKGASLMPVMEISIVTADRHLKGLNLPAMQAQRQGLVESSPNF